MQSLVTPTCANHIFVRVGVVKNACQISTWSEQKKDNGYTAELCSTLYRVRGGT